MKFEEYQKETDKTDILSQPEHKQSGVNILVPILGLAGCSGKLLTEYKKRLRDGKSHLLFKDRIADELGTWVVFKSLFKSDHHTFYTFKSIT